MDEANSVNVLEQDEVEKILSDVLEKENLVGSKLVVSAGSEKGDGYSSIMTKVEIIGKNRTLNVLIKSAPKSELIRKLMPMKAIFEREIFFYETIYPVFLEFQEKKKIEGIFNNVPKCYGSSVDPYEYIILEDIRYSDFKLWDRTTFMNDDHLKLILETYGKYHAVSYAMKDQEKTKFETFYDGLVNIFAYMDDNHPVFQSLQERVNKVAQLFTEETEKYEALMKVKANMGEYFKFAKSPTDTSVVAHGDCWCNNIMFKYGNNNKEPTDISLIDFQLIGFTSPVLDLSYFFYASAPKSAMDNLEYYLKIYYESLNKHAELLGTNLSEIFTYDDLMKDWKTYGKFGFCMGLLIVLIMLSKKGEIMDFGDGTVDENTFSSVVNKDLSNETEISDRCKDLVNHMFEKKLL